MEKCLRAEPKISNLSKLSLPQPSLLVCRQCVCCSLATTFQPPSTDITFRHNHSPTLSLSLLSSSLLCCRLTYSLNILSRLPHSTFNLHSCQAYIHQVKSETQALTLKLGHGYNQHLDSHLQQRIALLPPQFPSTTPSPACTFLSGFANGPLPPSRISSVVIVHGHCTKFCRLPTHSISISTGATPPHRTLDLFTLCSPIEFRPSMPYI